MPSRSASALGAVLLVLGIGAAVAQQMPTLPNVQARPVANPMGSPVNPVSFGNQQRDATTGAAPIPSQPEGGFAVVPPSPGKEDPAQRMSLKNAGAAVGQYGSSADSTLTTMTTGALPTPRVRGESDLVELQQVQRQMQLLDAKEKLAEIAVKYWGVVFNNDNAKAWRASEEKKAVAEAEAKRKAQEAEEERQKMAALQSAAGPGHQAAPTAADAKVYDVMGSRAGISYPGGGLMYVSAGDTLPDGSKVVAVDASGVVATVNGKRVRMGMMQAMATAKK